MPILKLTPSCKDYLWGGSRLRTDFGIKSDLDPLAEAWVLSCHPDGPSYSGRKILCIAAYHRWNRHIDLRRRNRLCPKRRELFPARRQRCVSHRRSL